MNFYKTIQAHVRAALFGSGVLTVFSTTRPELPPIPEVGDMLFNGSDMTHDADPMFFNVTGLEPDSLVYLATPLTYDGDSIVFN